MNLSNNELDQLFKDFCEGKPEASYKETQKAFLESTIIAAGGVLATKSILKLFTFKQWIIMISVLTTATIGTLLVSMSAAPLASEKKTESVETSPKEISIEANYEKPEAPKEKLETFVATLEYLTPEVKAIISPESKTPIQVMVYRKSDGSYHFIYIITSETTKEDLVKLQKEAKDAGFEMVCTPNFEQNKLKHLSIHIVQKENDGQKTDILISDIDLEEKAEYKVAWNVDEEGTATTIACGDDYKSEEINELLAGLNIDGLTNEIIGLYDVYNKELSNLGELELVDLAHYQKEMELASEMLQNEEVRTSLLELESIEMDDLEDMISDLDDALEDLKELEGEFSKGSQKIIEALHEDGLIKDKKKRINMRAMKGELEVNGKKIPKNLKKKYEKLIQECFDVDITDRGTEWKWSFRES